MSVFRPAARVRSPDGRDWEIYAYKLQVGERPEWDSDVVTSDVGAYPAAAEIEIVNALVWIVLLVPRLLLRLGDAAFAALRAVRSDEWRIEAITFMPQKQSYVWLTTKEYRGQVLAQVQGSLARGDVPQHLRNATYAGWSRSAR